MDSFAEGDPAIERYQTLIDALGHPPALSAFEQATIARLAAWTTADDVNILARLITQARGDAQAEADGGTE